MIKLSNSKILQILTKIFILIVIAKTISITLLWYLPSDGVELNNKKNFQVKYSRVNFQNMIKNSTNSTSSKTQSSSTQTSVSIKTLVLKGLYGKKTKGFIIIAKKSTPKKTTILEVGEIFEGYKLKYINLKDAVLTKGSKEFKISLEKIIKQEHVEQELPTNTQKIKKQDLKRYAKNPSLAAKDISVKDFKITRIKPKSVFAKLGLKKGDKILKINNNEVKSYADVMEFYKNMDKLDIIQIVVMRNKQETELVYEIN